MQILKDNRGNSVVLSDESEEHIKDDHPEMRGRMARIKETILQPDTDTPSKADERATVFYRLYEDDKYVCVVVKYLDTEAYVSTAYETRNVR